MRLSAAGALCLIGLAGCRAAPLPTDDLAEIARVEDLRDDANPGFAAWLAHSRPEVRAAAARALGRIRAAASVPALAAAAQDRAPAVRSAALFALGQIPEPEAIEALLGHLQDKDASDRALAVASLGRTAASAHWRAVADLLKDRTAAVRGAAALATVPLAGDRLRGSSLISASSRGQLVQLLSTALLEERDRDVAWRIVYALAHMVDARAEAALLLAARTDTPAASSWSRLFATRGLGALPASSIARDRLLANAGDADARVAFEAVRALGARTAADEGDTAAPRHDTAEVVASLQRTLASHPVAHVRAAAATALATFGGHRQEILPVLRAACTDDSRSVRAKALESLGALGGAGEVDAALVPADASDYRVLIGAAHGYAACSPVSAEGLAKLFDQTDDVRVRTAVLDLVAAHPAEPQLRELAVRACTAHDLGIREAAATALAVAGDSSALPALQDAYRDSPGPDFVQARKQLVRAIARSGGDRRSDGIAMLREALTDAAVIVRREAARQLRGLGESVADDAVGRPSDLITPVLGRDVPWKFVEKQPRVTFRTTRGAFTIVLYPEVAPIHCFNLVALAERRAYVGRLFHRVVPDFVVQGGDARGDGYGNRAWHGGQLRDEIGPLPFEAGVVGMPKSEDADTGGDQFFITTVPTPHLDGRYTAFGRVTEGFEVLAAIEVGDVITDIAVHFD